MFDLGILKENSFDCKVITVGNLTAGGTGKTPFVRYLIEQLQKDKKLGVLSRGYNRKSKGFVLAKKGVSPEQIGDEPMMYSYHYSDNVTVAVCEDRVLAIPQLIALAKIDTVILDDAYQHRYVKPDLNVLMTDYNNLFISDYVLPAGLLRESKAGAKRSGFVVVSKCPEDISENRMNGIRESIEQYSGHSNIAFTEVCYLSEVGCEIGESPIIVFSGIAQNVQFQDKLKEQHKVLSIHSFPDHYWYEEEDIKNLIKEFEKYKSKNPVIVTTEKDFMRLQSPILKELIEDLPLCYIPIEVKFIEGEKELLNMLKSTVN